MTGSRLTSQRIRQLIGELPARYVAPLPHLARARLLTGTHLDRLLTEPDMTTLTAGRVRRRVMTRLAGLGLVATLERRIGGVRAGSAGHIYTLSPAGHTFLALRDNKPRPPRQRHANRPGWEFLAHALDISEIYVHLTQTAATATGAAVTVSAFVTEPDCWFHPAPDRWIRPDAYTVLQTPTHADCWWLEIDRDTESPARIASKCRTYAEHIHHGGTGPDGAPPRILFTASTTDRLEVIQSAIDTTGSDMLTAILHGHAARYMLAELNYT